MITAKGKTAVFAVLSLSVLVASLAVPPARTSAQGQAHAATSDSAEDKRWLAVAPGRVEPRSGVIKVAAPVMGVISEVLVRANDTVFAGEPLVVSEARSFIDKAVADRRAGRGSDTDVDAARAGLARAQDRLKLQSGELRRIEYDAPLPTLAEGQLNVARSELSAAQAAMENTTIRASIGGTILQMNARPGELASPSTTQPLVLLGDVSALRVRGEVDERDIEKIKVGQSVLVRPAALRGREIAGTVSFVAPLVEAGRNNAPGQRNMTDVDVVEVLVELSEPGPLAVGMKVDVYFRQDNAQR